MQQTTLSYAQSHFSEMCHQIIENQDILLVTQEKSENIVMMPQSLFDSWQETMYLLKSPANRAMLEKSIAEHQTGQTFERSLVNAENN